jgi:DNA-binding MarR family transcriptional regulator
VHTADVGKAGTTTARANRRLAAEIGSLLARSRRQVFQKARRRLEALGQSIFEWRLLAHLHDEGPSMQAELADATAQHPASISRLLDDMEASGLVVRRRDTVDRRRVMVELAPAGKEKYEAHYDEAVSVMEESLAPLQPDEQELLKVLLSKMIAAR